MWHSVATPWSSYPLAGPRATKSMRASALTSDKAKKLVFVRANLKLEAKDYDPRPFIAWDPESVESDGFLGDVEEIENSDSDGDVDFDF